MATAPKTADAIDRSTCAMCLEIYNRKDRTPKALPCLHTFCKQCLEVYLEHHKDKKKLQCPTCREKFERPANGVNGFRNNFHLFDLLDENGTTEDKKEYSVSENDVKTFMQEKLIAQVKSAKKQVIKIGENIQSELEQWQFAMLEEIDKMDVQTQAKIQEECAATVLEVKQHGKMEQTQLFQHVSCPMKVNSGLKLERTGSETQLIKHSSAGQIDEHQSSRGSLKMDNSTLADVRTRNTMSFPYNSSASASVSENGTVLITRNNAQRVLLYKYDDGYYKHEKSFELDVEMHGSKAFLTPDGNHIILSKHTSSRGLFSSRKSTETMTWIMNSRMELVSKFSGEIGQLLSVTDSRLLYKQNDVCGTVLTVYDFQHTFMMDVVQKLGKQGTVVNAVLNPSTHNIAVLVEEKAQTTRTLLIYDPQGKQVCSGSHDVLKMEQGSRDHIILSGKEQLGFYDWQTGHLSHRISSSGVTFMQRVASFPPENVHQSRDTHRILHILTQKTPVHKKRLIAYRADF